MPRFSDFDIKTLKKETMLTKYITVAPLHHNYALCIDYIRRWFLEKFEKDFFCYIFVDGSHVFGEFDRLGKDKIISHRDNDKPVLTIVPQIEESYNRERIDMNLFGIDQFINTTKIDKSFFQDPVNNKYIMMKMDMVLMNFTFKIKTPSRATQLDLFKYIQLAFRVGLSETRNIDMDYLIPYSMMLNIASDCGFEIKDDKIVNPIKFLTYLNSRSFVPIIYKRNNVSAREEYFVRMENLPVRIGMESSSKDDGTKEGHLATDFGIEFNINVRCPGMQLYVYFTKNQHRFVPQDKEVYNIDNTLIMALHQMNEPPSINNKGWNLYIKTDWEEDGYNPIEIDMDELFEGELRFMIESHKKRFVNHALFMDVQLFNDGFKLPAYMDWETMKLSCPNIPNKLISTIAIYVDLKYLNSQRMDVYENPKDRIRYSKNP